MMDTSHISSTLWHLCVWQCVCGEGEKEEGKGRRKRRKEEGGSCGEKKDDYGRIEIGKKRGWRRIGGGGGNKGRKKGEEQS